MVLSVTRDNFGHRMTVDDDVYGACRRLTLASEVTNGTLPVHGDDAKKLPTDISSQIARGGALLIRNAETSCCTVTARPTAQTDDKLIRESARARCAIGNGVLCVRKTIPCLGSLGA